MQPLNQQNQNDINPVTEPTPADPVNPYPVVAPTAPATAAETVQTSAVEATNSFATAQANMATENPAPVYDFGAALAPQAAVFGSSSFPDDQSTVSGGAPVGPKPKMNKKLLAIIASVGAVILTGSAAFAYVAIKNSPEMILRDAFYATSSKTQGLFDATLNMKTGGETTKILVDGAWKDDSVRSLITLENAMLPQKKVSVHQFNKDDKFYLKFDDIRKNIDGLDPELKKVTTVYDGLINRIDGKWVVITEGDLEQYFGIKTEKDKSSVCVENTLKSYQSDKSQQKEVLDVYTKNQFLTLTKLADEQVDGRNAYHFSVVYVKDKAVSFAKTVVNTKLYKNVKDCFPEDATSNDDDLAKSLEKADTSKMPAVDVWVDKESRTLRKVQLKTKEDAKDAAAMNVDVAVVFDYFSPVEMKEPKADVTVGELMTEIQKLEQAPQAQMQGVDTVQTVLGISDER